MRLATDHGLAAGNVSVPCYVCGKMTTLAQCVSDLDGPAFQAYYCPECVKPLLEHHSVAKCQVDGCKRGGPAHA